MTGKLRPPWIKTTATANIAKRVRAFRIMKDKGIKPLTKAEARTICADATAKFPKF